MAMRTDKVIRCSSPAVSYGKVLAGLNIPEADVRKTQEILREVPQLADLFLNPTVAQQKKMDVIGRVFPETMHSFMKRCADTAEWICWMRYSRHMTGVWTRRAG